MHWGATMPRVTQSSTLRLIRNAAALAAASPTLLMLLFHIISARPSKQPRMVRTFLKVYMELGSYFFLFFGSARTNKRLGMCNYGGLIDTLFTDVEGVA